MKSVESTEALVGEGALAHLSRKDEGQQTTSPPMDNFLIQSAEKGRADALVAPVRMESESEQVGVGTAHSGHHCANQDSRRRHGCDRWLMLVEGLDDVASAVGR